MTVTGYIGNVFGVHVVVVDRARMQKLLRNTEHRDVDPEKAMVWVMPERRYECGPFAFDELKRRIPEVLS